MEGIIIKKSEDGSVEFIHSEKDGIIKGQVFTQKGLKVLLEIAEENMSRIDGDAGLPIIK